MIMTDQRRTQVYEILITKMRNNLDVLFDFTLSDKEFKETYKVTKAELKEIA